MKSLLKKIVPSFVFSWYHFGLVFLGALIYGFPSRKLIVIGVTGTNGKSTVVHLVTEILEQSGFKIASLSSIKFKINKKEWPNMLKMTMPGRFKLQGFLRQTVKAGCKYVVLEITSEGIKQCRHRFIDFDGAVFTNLTREHLEAHKGFENYKEAKGKLFRALRKSRKKNKFAVFNADDKHSEYYAKLVGDAKKYFYSIKNSKIETLLPGEFNIYNAAAAVEITKALGLSLRKTLRILKSIKEIPGRMELVIDKPFKIFVDYAHTPDALEKVYKTLGKGLICVLGAAGGGRDRWKRPEMGKIAINYCDEIILTNEDPYNEDPVSIIKDVEAGFLEIRRSKIEVRKIIDRREAIHKALSLAKKGDTVIITGKGCEPWMCIEEDKKTPWDDRKVVREEFEKIKNK
jgi:UDP-N-acetylmuramoyl-L-alanyl-D-glutamate--2,6-diaminopimelate ligase